MAAALGAPKEVTALSASLGRQKKEARVSREHSSTQVRDMGTRTAPANKVPWSNACYSRLHIGHHSWTVYDPL